jgi:enterochelin esterase-like enzyme
MLYSRLVRIEHTSAALQDNAPGDPATRTLPVYLPPGYEDHPDRRYPVIWMLAPFASWGERLFNLQAWDENIVQQMDRLIEEGTCQPALMAFPDAFTRYGGSQYVNSTATGRYEDYVVEELVPLVDERFRTLAAREHRATMGYSSGGYGALTLAMRHPDVFGAAASHSGDMLFEACYRPDIPGAIRGYEQAGGVEAFVASMASVTRPRDKGRIWFDAVNITAMSACYSPNPDADIGFDLPFDPYTGLIREDVWARWKAVDPVAAARDHADALRSLRLLYFDCGSADEYNLFLGARVLDQVLDDLDVPHTYDEHDSGHGNINWRYDISLPLLTEHIAPEVS